MKAGVFVVCTRLAVCLAFPVIRCAAADSANLMPLAEVHTWGDLLAQKPVTLRQLVAPPKTSAAASYKDKTLTVRLGIDRTHAGRDGCVVLYCLAEGELILVDWLRPDDDQCLGPVSVDVEGPVKAAKDQVAQAFGGDRFMLSHPRALFMKTVPLNKEGSYTITVRQTKGNESAAAIAITSAKVVVSAKEEAVWSPWVNAKYHDEQTSTDGPCSMDVVNPSGGIALPKCDGAEPAFLDKLPDAKRALPALIAAEPDAGIPLALKGNALIVKLDEKEGLTDDAPDEHFLTRWWVNGKPFIPTGEIALEGRAGSGHPSSVTEMDFIMEFHPEALGVKKGDTVGVQLLFCSKGWEPAGFGQNSPDEGAPLPDEGDDPQLKSIARPTNRVEFVYTGDPKAFAGK